MRGSVSPGKSIQFIVVMTISSLTLVACGSNQEDASSNIKREASIARGTEVCVSREANTGPMTVEFVNSTKSIGNGPFNLDYVQCGEKNGLAAAASLRLIIKDSTGTNALGMISSNPDVGYPKLGVGAFPDGAIEYHTFSEGETYTFNAGSYSVRVERQPDTDTAKSFRAFVSRS